MDRQGSKGRNRSFIGGKHESQATSCSHRRAPALLTAAAATPAADAQQGGAGDNSSGAGARPGMMGHGMMMGRGMMGMGPGMMGGDLRRQMIESWVEAQNRKEAVLTPEQKEQLRGYGQGGMMW